METQTEGNTATSSHHMASLVPSFDPSKDDLEQYTQKIELLSTIWPEGKLNELIARLMLNTSGTAFQKLQLNKEKIMTNNAEGVKQLVSLLGGHGGKVNLEKKYEIVEKALYRCVQRQDESHDSYLARCDVVWSELGSKKIDLKEIQAYIVLKGSLLSSEDKKRVIVESGTTANGALTIEKVTASVRMLGTSFFNEMIGQKRTKGKIYESQAMLAESLEEDEAYEDENAYVAEDATGEAEFYDQLLQDQDEDAALVADFESAAMDAVQGDGDLAAAFTSYTEARRRLSERFKHRGFWPITQPQKGKGKSHKGKGKGRGKHKKPLQQRILESTCRLCWRQGHWKAECPERNNPDRLKPGNSSAPSGTSAAMTASARSINENAEPDVLLMEFMQLPSVNEEVLDVPSLQEINMSLGLKTEVRENLRRRGNGGNHETLRSSKTPRSDVKTPAQAAITVSHESFDTAFFLTQGTCGILDTGATKSVIGSKLLPALIESLPDSTRQKMFRTTCAITFRFGNQGTLDSQQALVIPLSSIGLGLKIAIVPGETPLLLSNTMIRTLKACVDSEHDLFLSPYLKHHVKLQLNPRGLYLLDLNDLLNAQREKCIRSSLATAETFLSSDFSENVKQPDSSGRCKQQLQAPNHSHVSSTTIFANSGREACSGNSGKPGPCEITVHTSQENSHDKSRPEKFSRSFLDLVQQTEKSHHVQHELVPALGTCHVELEPGGHRGFQEADRPADGRMPNHLRESTHEQNICRSLGERERMGEVVHNHLCQQLQDRPPESSDLLRKDDRVHGELPTGVSAVQSRDHSTQDQSNRQEPISRRPGSCSTSRDPSGSSRRTGGSGSMGCHGRAADIPESRQPGSDCGVAGSNASHGECHRRDSESPSTERLDPLACFCQAGDIDADFEDIHFHNTQPNQIHRMFKAVIQKYTTELINITQQVATDQSTLHVLEIFCSDQSELTRQTNQLGYRAKRHGLSQGDLSTVEGRQTLFKTLVSENPQNVWYSPTCGPWCSWSFLNESKTQEGFDRIHEKRMNHLYQLALGVVIFRYQVSMQRHMHWEQPRRSLMLRIPVMQEISNLTLLAVFDMCQVGALRDPQTQMLYKKGMEIATTSQHVYVNLHGRTCRGSHQHQPLIEGETMVKGHRIRRTEYSENYTRKFARTMHN